MLNKQFKNLKTFFLSHKLIKETVWSFLTKGFTFLLLFSTNVGLAKILGAEKYGTWSFFYSAFTIITTISFLGINASSQKYVAQYNKTKKISRVFWDSLMLRLLFSLIFSFLIILFHKELALILKKTELSSLVLLSVPLLFFSGLVEFFKNVFTGLHRNVFNFFINMIQYGTIAISVFLLIGKYPTLQTVLIIFIISSIISTVFGFTIINRHFYKKDDLNSVKNFKKEILRYSVPFLLLQIAFLVQTELDTVFLGLHKGETELAYYAFSKQIINKLTQVNMILAMGVMPIFGKLDETNKEELKKSFNKIQKLNFFIISMLVIFLWVFLPFFVNVIFNNNYQSNFIMIRILLLGFLFSSYAAVNGSLLDYTGLASKRMICSYITLVFTLVFYIFLIPKFGAVGAAYSNLFSSIIYFLLIQKGASKSWQLYEQK